MLFDNTLSQMNRCSFCIEQLRGTLSIILMLIKIMMDDITKHLLKLNYNIAHCFFIFILRNIHVKY